MSDINPNPNQTPAPEQSNPLRDSGPIPTPLTNANVLRYSTGELAKFSGKPIVHADFACSLERELDRLRAERDTLKAVVTESTPWRGELLQQARTTLEQCHNHLEHTNFVTLTEQVAAALAAMDKP